MAKKFLVIGTGRFGSALVKELHNNKHEVIAVDTNEKNLQSIDEHTVYCVIGDAKDDNVIEELDVKQFDVAIVAIGDGFEASILITKKLKDAGCEFVISKANNKQMGEILLAVGANEVVFPEEEAGIKTAKHLSYNGIIEYIDINDEVSGIEIKVPSEFFGKTLSDLNFTSKYGLTVALILRDEKPLLSHIAYEAFREGDCFLIIGENSKINQFKNKFCN